MTEQTPQEVWTAVDEWSFGKLHSRASATPSPDALEAAHANSEKQGLPDIAVSPSQGKYLKLQAQLIKAKNILEVGTLGGYSTIWLASASNDVKVVTVEVDPHHAEVARENLRNAGLADRVDVKLGPGIKMLPQLVEEVQAGTREKFDLVFVDADKENNWNYVDAALEMTNSGGLVIVDNVARRGKLAVADTGDSRVEGARKVVENVGRDDRLDGVVLQTVGDKGYDGFLIAVIR